MIWQYPLASFHPSPWQSYGGGYPGRTCSTSKDMLYRCVKSSVQCITADSLHKVGAGQAEGVQYRLRDAGKKSFSKSVLQTLSLNCTYFIQGIISSDEDSVQVTIWSIDESSHTLYGWGTSSVDNYAKMAERTGQAFMWFLPRSFAHQRLCLVRYKAHIHNLGPNRSSKPPHFLAIWLLLFKQRRMRFKPIKRRLFRWTGGREQQLKQWRLPQNSWNFPD